MDVRCPYTSLLPHCRPRPRQTTGSWLIWRSCAAGGSCGARAAPAVRGQVRFYTSGSVLKSVFVPCCAPVQAAVHRQSLSHGIPYGLLVLHPASLMRPTLQLACSMPTSACRWQAPPLVSCTRMELSATSYRQAAAGRQSTFHFCGYHIPDTMHDQRCWLHQRHGLLPTISVVCCVEVNLAVLMH
jgi:hypothetical protein